MLADIDGNEFGEATVDSRGENRIWFDLVDDEVEKQMWTRLRERYTVKGDRILVKTRYYETTLLVTEFEPHLVVSDRCVERTTHFGHYLCLTETDEHKADYSYLPLCDEQDWVDFFTFIETFEWPFLETASMREQVDGLDDLFNSLRKAKEHADGLDGNQRKKFANSYANLFAEALGL
ncbi:hypothetical protein ROZALSC1DRAFT_27560 [Rozella allomycis CSF55]|uniref:Uncharacterized protein n=1 Tax=Rozella allomycis (strain CSF55) TaxID=988480 RepID=A0A075AN23_ROZAC|nr:hypothetical protein O9G_001019 [Rozella allomycis CSF55]RKP20991.1 hypothetical protein ROZALSC1DRAFT_27560 [Rozella allomycis CSF55]|eukprot:EPZ31108.1 hypothetical protein O9G_001019 [Rozella allomycis CSF55]